MLWRIDTLDTGGESRPPREAIRNFAAGYPRTFQRQIAGIPTGNPVVQVVVRARRSRSSDSELVFEKVLTTTFDLSQGQIISAGTSGTATIEFLLYGVETAQLTRRCHMECVVTLADGVTYPAMLGGTIKGNPSLIASPSGIPLAASVITANKTTDALADDATDTIIFTVTDVLGAVCPGITLAIASDDATKVSVSANSVVTNDAGQATITVRKLVALGDGVEVAIHAAISPSLQYPVTITDGTGGGGGGTPVLAVRWVPAGPTSVASDAANQSYVVRTYSDVGATVEVTGRAVTISNPNAAVATRAPASGVSPLTVALDPIAAGGPLTFTATSEGVTRDLAFTVTAPAGGGDPLLDFFAALGDDGDGSVVDWCYGGSDASKITVVGGDVTVIKERRGIAGRPDLPVTGTGVTHDPVAKSLAFDGTSEAGAAAVGYSFFAPGKDAGPYALVEITSYALPPGGNWYYTILSDGVIYVGTAKTAGDHLGSPTPAIDSGVAPLTGTVRVVITTVLADGSATKKVLDHAAGSVAAGTVGDTTVGTSRSLTIGNAQPGFGGGGATVDNILTVYEVFKVKRALTAGEEDDLFAFAASEYGAEAAA